MHWGYTMSGMKMGNARMKLLAGAILFCAGGALATSAMSATLYGGGATLPAGGYVGWNFLVDGPSASDPARLTPTGRVDSGSLFGAWAATTTNAIQYCQTGSGGGKRVLNGDTSGSPSLTAGGTCADFNGVTPLTGFQITDTNSVQPDFVASDAPMSQAEYTTYLNNKGAAHVEPIQFPALVGSIAMIYNNSDVTATHLALTDTMVCKMFSGVWTNWNQLATDAGVNLGLPSKAIKLVYRSDGSGTSFNFSNHLAAVCQASGVTVGGHFDTDQTFVAAAGVASVTKDLIGFPSTAVGQNGNPAVANAVASTDGAFGYAETANAIKQSGTSLKYATVNGKDPVTDLGTSGSFGVSTPVTDKAITGVDPLHGTPVLSALTTVPGTANCTLVVDPNTYSQPANGYPIVAVTYLLANSHGNGGQLTALRSFLLNPYGAHSGVNTVGAGTGFAFITGTGITALKVNGCTAI